MIDVHFFKPSGKWYETEKVNIPEGTQPWEARPFIVRHVAGRLTGMTAVIIDAPWGFPMAFHDLGRADD